MNIRFFCIVLLLACTLACAARPAQAQSLCGSVPSGASGASFGNVIVGQAYLYQASGCIAFSSSYPIGYTDPDGNISTNGCASSYTNVLAPSSYVCPGLRGLSLVGKIGSTCIQLGSSGIFVAPASGPLTLYYNEDNFSDNSGSWSVCLATVNSNSWTSPTDGFWHDVGNWSLGILPANSQLVLITNASSKTVTIDSTTSGSYPDSMNVLGLTLSADSPSTNILALANAGLGVPFQVGTVLIAGGGVLTISNASLQLLGGPLSVDGLVQMDSGLLAAKAGALIGASDSGTLTLAGGTLGLVNSDSPLFIGYNSGSTGSLWVTGGQVTGTNSPVFVGYNGSGQMIVSKGIVQASVLHLAYGGSSQGTLTMAGGTITTTSLQGSTNGVVDFLAGVIQTGGTSLGNPLTVGDGGNLATLQFLGGTHSFGSSLTISSNAQLTGCGTVTSVILNYGTILSDCPSGTLAFSSVVTNYGILIATNGALLTFYGTVVNNGTIDATAGAAHFFSNVVNNGTILPVGAWFSPAAPSNLVANIVYPDLSHVYLAWQDNANNEFTYLVDRDTNGLGFVQLATLPADSTNYTDGLFSSGQRVTDPPPIIYRVHATNSIGSSDYSNIATASLYTVTNSWNNAGDGAWQDATNWSLGTAPANIHTIVITNNTSKAVTIDSITSASFSNTLTVTDLILSTPSGSTNALNVLDLGSFPPLKILHSLILSNGGSLYVTNSTLRQDGLINGVFVMDGNMMLDTNSLLTAVQSLVGLSPDAHGTVLLTGGQMLLTNIVPSAMGLSGNGEMVVSNGQLLTSGFMFVGSGNGSQGTLTVVGGNYSSSYGRLVVGGAAGSVGTVRIDLAGRLILTNSSLTLLGCGGSGELKLFTEQTQSATDLSNPAGTVQPNWTDPLPTTNLSVLLGPVEIGGNPGSQGTLTVAGGTNSAGDVIIIASTSGSTGAIWMVGGQIVQTNVYRTASTNFWPTYVGSWGVGTLTLSNGNWRGGIMIAGSESNSQGTVTLNGGSMSLLSKLVIGNCSNGAAGAVTVAGGNLYVTNAAHNAFIDVRNGQLNLHGGVLQTDKLVMTNTCGLLVRDGGTLIVGSLLLNPNLSAIGDGIPNGWKQQHGLDPLDPTVASGDPDGDGFNTLQEYLAGTDPTNGASAFRIISILPEGNDFLITWMATTNKTYVVQVTTNPVDGSYTNAFTDLATVAVPLSPLITQTNYLDIGAVTNAALRFYRIRLGP